MVAVALQLPSGATVAVAITLPLASLTVMVSPGVPVPVRVGVVSAVLPSPTMPVSLLLARAAAGAPGAVVSMVMGSAVGWLTLPARSVAVTLRAFRPLGSAVVGVALQLPSPSTTAVAMTLPLASLMVMVASGSPVPLRVGVLSLVVLSPRVPVSLLGSSTAAGAAGAVVSIVTLTVPGALVLPAGSVAVICSALVPCGKAVDVMAQLPAASTTAVPSTVVPLGAYSVMVSPAVPVPTMVGVVSLVMLSVALMPVSLAAATSPAGTEGAVVSNRSSLVLVSLVLLLAASVMVATTG